MCLVSIKLHFIGICLVQLEIPDVHVTQKGEDNHCQMARRHGENADVHSAAFPPPSYPGQLWVGLGVLKSFKLIYMITEKQPNLTSRLE